MNSFNIFKVCIFIVPQQSSFHESSIPSSVGSDCRVSNDDITQAEITDVIAHLKPRKAPGIDNVIGEMLKCSSRIILPYLWKLFNAILQNSTFPKSWSKSVIVPLHKRGAFDDPNNYKGVYLTRTLSKVFLHIFK